MDDFEKVASKGSRQYETLGRGGGSYWYPTLEPLGEPLSTRLQYLLNTIDLISQCIIILTITINFWWEFCQNGACSSFLWTRRVHHSQKGVGQLFHNYSPVSDPHSESIRDSRPKIQSITLILVHLIQIFTSFRKLVSPSKIVFRTE